MKVWNVNIKSVINKPENLTYDEIHKAVFAIADPISTNYHKEYRETLKKEYKGTQGEWQVNKSEEIEQKFIENLKLLVTEDTVTVSTTYDIEFPDDWDRGFVIDWSEGMIRLSQEYLFVVGEKLIDGIPKDLKYNESRSLLTDLIRNQIFDIK